MNMHIIFLDANFILVPAQLSVDIYGEFERLMPKPYILIVIRPVLEELEKKKKERRYKGAFSRQLGLGLQLLDRRYYAIYNISRPNDMLVDDLLIEIISEWKRGAITNPNIKGATLSEPILEAHIPPPVNIPFMQKTMEDTKDNAGQGKDSKKFMELLKLLEHKIEEIKTDNKNEDSIKLYLATNDKELRKKATERAIPVIYVRQSSFLEIE